MESNKSGLDLVSIILIFLTGAVVLICLELYRLKAKLKAEPVLNIKVSNIKTAPKTEAKTGLTTEAKTRKKEAEAETRTEHTVVPTTKQKDDADSYSAFKYIKM